MTDDTVLESLFELDSAPAREIANHLDAPVPDVLGKLQVLEANGLVEKSGEAFELTELGTNRVDALTA